MPKMKLRPHNSKVCSSLPHFLGFEHLQSPHDGQALGWGKKRPPACHPGQTRDPFKGIQFKGVTTGTSQGCDEKRKEYMYIRLPGSGNPARPQQGTKMPPNLSEASLRNFFCLLFIAMAHTARVPVLLQKATKSHMRGWQTACLRASPGMGRVGSVLRRLYCPCLERKAASHPLGAGERHHSATVTSVRPVLESGGVR